MIGRDRTEVVAFAEHVEPVAAMGRLHLGGASITILVQGAAWIGISDYEIFKMRTDLLAPLPSAGLRGVKTVMLIAENQFQGVSTVFWFPQKVTVNVAMGDSVFLIRHMYSHYQLFMAKSVIKPDAGVPDPH